MNEPYRMTKKIPLGATCHYERKDGKWFVIWGDDFESGGKVEAGEKDATLLEMGYQQKLAEHQPLTPNLREEVAKVLLPLSSNKDKRHNAQERIHALYMAQIEQAFDNGVRQASGAFEEVSEAEVKDRIEQAKKEERERIANEINIRIGSHVVDWHIDSVWLKQFNSWVKALKESH